MTGSKDKEILIGVTGGIAAYKVATLVSLLKRHGLGVSVMMTESAMQLVSPQTFSALSGRPVRSSLWDRASAHPHIDLARVADLLCIAPATANIMAKSAHGLADDLVSTTILAFDGPIIMAPAMNRVMWEKPATQRNCEQLRNDGIELIGPESGHLSCGESGAGRMVEPETLFEAIMSRLS
ncbi:MAG: flavoprotein [Planctomycetia bacterium]|nr:flavoprotein [Planctomycetia bacterium]